MKLNVKLPLLAGLVLLCGCYNYPPAPKATYGAPPLPLLTLPKARKRKNFLSADYLLGVPTIKPKDVLLLLFYS